ncbi:MAG: spermidine/putrescine ABC transporter substrate-binding protein [Thermoanaerobaculia bacterium]
MRDSFKLAAAAALVLLSAACGPKEPAPAGTTPASGSAMSPTAATASPGGPCQLNVFIWSEYIDPAIITDFEKEFACKVTLDLYEDNESMMSKLQGGGTSLYDVVVPSQYVIPVMVKLGLLAELRHENIPNLSNLDEKFVSPVFDVGNRYSAAYQWGTIGIYLRKKPGKAVDETWALLFDKQKQYGSFLLMDSVREMMGAMAKYKGLSVNSTSLDDLRAESAALGEAKQRSQGFEGGVGGKNKVLSKAVDAAVVYNGDAVRGTTDDPETYYFVPREGGVLWVDSMAVPAKAPHRDIAEKFINFILSAKVGAQLSNFNQYATPNKASRAFITPADLANTAIYPPAEMMPKLEFVNDLGDDNRLYDEVWTQVKSK